MKIGYFGINNGPVATGEAIVRILRCLEDAGFESAWTGEHLVLSDPQQSPSPLPPDYPILDTIATLAFAAAHTTRLKLGTGIILLAQRNPVVLAKELSSIDVLANGRLLFGVGVGYVRREFDVLGVPYHERGARVDEYIQAMRALWTQAQPEFQGQFIHVSGVQQKPSPIQAPHPPIIIGGMSCAAYRRAIALGDGWFGFNLKEDDVAASIRGLQAAAAAAGTLERFERLEISITPRGAIDPDRVRRFADMGVSRLVLRPQFSNSRGSPLDIALRFVESTSETLSLC